MSSARDLGGAVRWHLIRKPKAPFVCDECGQEIPLEQADTFTTLEHMYFETPPSGYVPCNQGYDALGAKYSNIKH